MLIGRQGVYSTGLLPAIRTFLRAEGNLLCLILFAAIVVVLMGILNPGKFLTARNLTSLSFQFPELGIFALAIMLSLITAGIDLSIVSTANLAGILAALVLTNAVPASPSSGQLALGIAGAIATALATGGLCGVFNGVLISRVGITPILATLGTMQLFMGISLIITKGPAVHGYPEPFLFIGNGTLGGVPLPLVIFLTLALVIGILLRKTPFGVNCCLLGTNEQAARFAGIDVRSHLVRTYIITGLLAGAAGIIMIARTNSAKADYGSSYLLQAILVAILGGVRPSGGFGSVSGLTIAVVSLQCLSSGFNLLRLNNFIKEFAWGAFLLVVMVVNYLVNQRTSR